MFRNGQATDNFEVEKRQADSDFVKFLVELAIWSFVMFFGVGFILWLGI